MLKLWLKRVLLILLLCLILFWAASCARCEILTLLHGQEFKDAYKEDTMLREQNNWKVLDYSPAYARVYYVDEYGGVILGFTRQGDQWIFAKWEETVWSKTGSASEFMWPYIR
ncbi:MAG TPA: hypothetical protein VN366_10910 [Feifaniaceae bacterium]|nr:hypothetical protein [Feifaniaceae bacterium]